MCPALSRSSSFPFGYFIGSPDLSSFLCCWAVLLHSPSHQHNQHSRCISKQQQITTHLNQTCDFISISLSSYKSPPLHTPVSTQPSFRGHSRCTSSKPSQKDMWLCFMCCFCVSVRARGRSLGGQQSLGLFLNSVPSILELMGALQGPAAVPNFWCVMENWTQIPCISSKHFITDWDVCPSHVLPPPNCKHQEERAGPPTSWALFAMAHCLAIADILLFIDWNH